MDGAATKVRRDGRSKHWELAQAMVKLPNLQLRGVMSIPDDAPDFGRNA